MNKQNPITRFYKYFKPDLIVLLLLLQQGAATAQKTGTNYVYQELIAKAGLYHLQKDYTKAIPIYKEAFTHKKPDALTAYKAAGVFALSDDVPQSIAYLQLAIDSGWTEADWLANDPYFSKIAGTAPEQWSQIKAKAYAAELKYTATLTAVELRKTINLMTLQDQQLRYKRTQLKDQSELDLVNKEINQADQQNLQQAKLLLSKYGWPKQSAIGKDGANNFWLVVQHADNDVIFQQDALEEMRKLMPTGEVNPEHYAFLLDRVQCNLNYKQTYGTQVVWTSNGEASGFRPILQEDLVDQRRKKLGLLPLRIYAMGYGFNYKNIAKEVAGKRDITDVLQARKLTDSIKWYYRSKSFGKAYAAADRASMIQGGMTDKDNLQAALLFAKMAAEDPDPKYKGIALDFLNLAAQRRKLTKSALAATEFKVLQKEPRWKEIEKQK